MLDLYLLLLHGLAELASNRRHLDRAEVFSAQPFQITHLLLLHGRRRRLLLRITQLLSRKVLAAQRIIARLIVLHNVGVADLHAARVNVDEGPSM